MFEIPAFVFVFILIFWLIGLIGDAIIAFKRWMNGKKQQLRKYLTQKSG